MCLILKLYNGKMVSIEHKTDAQIHPVPYSNIDYIASTVSILKKQQLQPSQTILQYYNVNYNIVSTVSPCIRL